jgi:hypothetical protein
MIELLRNAQLPFLALILLTASGAKLVGRSPFTLAVALAEGVLGIALLSTRLGIVRLASVVFFATATSVVAERARRGTAEGCGCFGTLSDAPSGRRGVVRAALMMVCAIAATAVPVSGFEVIWAATPQLVMVLAAEVALFLALSPELAAVTGRSRRHVPCELRNVPLAETYGTLRASNAWRANAELLTREEPSDVWRELCHRFVAYPARIGGRAGEVVFAIPIGGRPRSVRVGIVVDQVDESREDPLGSTV